MHQFERHAQIVESARQATRVEVTALAEQLGVTPETVRRDLTQLERKGLIRRVHGGAVAVEKLDFEPSSAVRLEQHAPEKRRIAAAALSCIPTAGSILLDAGTTTIGIAHDIPRDLDLNVLTNSLPVAEVIARRHDLQLHILGGAVRSRTDASIGTWGLRALEEVHVDVAFMGTNGISVETGFTTPDQSEAAIKRAMIAAAGRVIVLADSSKFGDAHFSKFADFSDVDTIITDGGIDADMANEIRSLGPEVLIA
ncbi:DeoR/GlpR family DNA-binding transcription regulator [Dermatophilus congolensis]|uniref:Lactose phosphotransferase system repressor n=1 Tax=Dermatophilus congolensis TaxID=1863 RepID=A0A239VLD4_9MICO|nr:DeoR/GlpR family DNA-binding transcription regulator [Dermatophilus congolensis]MBO3129305.1 DeoR/GlpR transcriptional regulator [Dermatophilus congolensis]MBO3132063.1 DeoR/GlpR transcriptional regulator [Dermatophilus congolensis]MBO3133781.1 DeoR/GlpR transcriptional regulator [Dermatophilus congolensis]MBO3136012.1 DeoR/GlpR transcriptional regulator [Dermatophilus congolensis]MBO3138253.1 DeoR/GlpR transcriptional regulator [Dermatophilus congolensis]